MFKRKARQGADMKKLARSLNIAVFVILLFSGCAHERFEASALKPGDEGVENWKEIVKLLLQELDGKSRLINQSVIYVSYKMDPGSYEGVPIEIRHYQFFLGEASRFPELSRDYSVLSYNQPEEIFATVRFSHDSHYTAYLLRAPSAYSSSAIDLWIYDRKDKVWLDPIRVADEFGDADWHFKLDGWFMDIDGDGSQDLIQRRRDSYEYGEKETDSLTIRMWKNGQFLPAKVSTDPKLLSTYDIPDW
jgi:hypothetical protein